MFLLLRIPVKSCGEHLAELQIVVMTADDFAARLLRDVTDHVHQWLFRCKGVAQDEARGRVRLSGGQIGLLRRHR